MVDLTAALIALLIAAGALPQSMQPGGGSGSAPAGTAGSACDTARDRRPSDGGLLRRLKENATSDEGDDPEASSGRSAEPDGSSKSERGTGTDGGTDRDRSARPYDVDEHRNGTDAEAERPRTPSDTGRNDTGRNDTGRNDTGRNDTGRNDTGRNGTGRNGTGRNGSDRNGSDRDGSDGVRAGVRATGAHRRRATS